ncbi:ATPase P [Candidatus Acidianus copahuensis]|uniref:ATPase P n=1 Tax=Candidatus Acidianus copahuensis TaxID=1160895 RepID=A0A031LMY6_9CREN|nr:cation-translocating P-type ATPase [Candidatus Acidianus copahuensis]EZQ02270.1 ATPase P [Candidatus Acidianus copahuensis]
MSEKLRIKRQEELKVIGMHCATCETTVSKAISSVKGVNDVRVNLATGQARVELDNAKLKDIINAVRKSGYDVLTQKVFISVSVNPEEISKIRELIESMPGVISASVSTNLASVEINPVSISAKDLEQELRKRGYYAKASIEKADLPEIEASKKELKSYIISLIIAVLFTVPTLILQYLGFPFFAIFTSFPVQFYSGLRFHKGAYRALKNKTTNMDTLVSLASNVAWFYSVYGVLTNSAVFFDASSLLILFILIGKTLEAYVKARVTNSVIGLYSVNARLIKGNREEIVSSSSLKVGDIVLVKSGEIIPADGIVEEGKGDVNEAIFTGESKPTLKTKGKPVIGGTVLINGFLKIYVTRSGERTYMAQVVQAIRESQGTKLPIQSLVDRVASIFVPVIIIISVLSFFIWHFILGFPLNLSILISVAVLASACPCPLGLATPLAVLTTVNKLAKKGIIIRNGESLERLQEIKTIILDKTGTITTGEFKVKKWTGNSFIGNLVSSLEKNSSHPVAKALTSLGNGTEKVEDFEEFPGEGVYGKVDGHSVIVGKPSFVVRNCEGEGNGDVLVCIDGEIKASVFLEDEIQGCVEKAIKSLKSRYTLIMATGDSSSSAELVGNKLGIKVYKGLSPEEKAELVKELKKEGGVAFIGDGVNDALPLKEADVGIAISSGSDIAKYAGDIIIPSLCNIDMLFWGSGRAIRKIKENLVWAFGYNSVLVPIAAGILYPFLLPPQYAALAMSMNSVSVVLWSMLR